MAVAIAMLSPDDDADAHCVLRWRGEDEDERAIGDGEDDASSPSDDDDDDRGEEEEGEEVTHDLSDRDAADAAASDPTRGVSDLSGLRRDAGGVVMVSGPRRVRRAAREGGRARGRRARTPRREERARRPAQRERRRRRRAGGRPRRGWSDASDAAAPTPRRRRAAESESASPRDDDTQRAHPARRGRRLASARAASARGAARPNRRGEDAAVLRRVTGPNAREVQARPGLERDRRERERVPVARPRRVAATDVREEVAARGVRDGGAFYRYTGLHTTALAL